MLGLGLGIAALVVLILAAPRPDGTDRWVPDAADVVRVDDLDRRPGQAQQANLAALFMAAVPHRADYAREEAGMRVAARGRAGFRIEIMNRCTVVFLHHVA
ncbi:hypothetical protein HPQ61_15060 [Acetobacteraceae bacterium]|nr:hypothetical protein [Acetobacteraceae bacterium]